MTERDFHPIADLFPLMEAADLDDLAADIREHDLREPIWLHPDGRIIDGRNRSLACEIAGVEPRFQRWDGKGSLAAFVVSLNLKRRHLTTSQRAMVAEKLATMTQGTRTDLGPIGTMSAAQAGNALSVSERAVKRARKVRKHGDPDLVSAVESGKKSVHAAEKEVREPELPSPREANERARRMKSRPARWSDAASRAITALEELQEMQSEYQDWMATLPDNLRESAVAEKLESITEIDFDGAIETVSAAEDADLPLGFGRD